MLILSSIIDISVYKLRHAKNKAFNVFFAKFNSEPLSHLVGKKCNLQTSPICPEPCIVSKFGGGVQQVEGNFWSSATPPCDTQCPSLHNLWSHHTASPFGILSYSQDFTEAHQQASSFGSI